MRRLTASAEPHSDTISPSSSDKSSSFGPQAASKWKLEVDFRGVGPMATRHWYERRMLAD